MSPVRVMVVEDQPLLREGLMALLDKRPELVTVVAGTGSPSEALALQARLSPDVTLVDLRLPEMPGHALIARMRAAGPGRQIVLTAYESDEDVYQALQQGARGYLLKGITPDELFDAIVRVHRGGFAIPSELAAKALAHGAGTGLSERQLEVVRLVAEGQSNKEIASALGIEEGTVKGYLSRVFQKVGVTSRAQLLVVALERGWIQLGRGGAAT